MTSTLRPLAFGCLAMICFAEGLGQFESSADVGLTPQKGKVEFDKREDIKKRDADRETKRATMHRFKGK